MDSRHEIVLYEGDSETVAIDSAAANDLPAGIVTGTVTFDNINGPGGDTTREVTRTSAATPTPPTTPRCRSRTTRPRPTIDINDAYCIGDVDIELDVSHTFIGDLIVELTSEGTTVKLHDRTGGSDSDIHNDL